MKKLFTLSFITLFLLNFSAFAQNTKSDADQLDSFRQLKAKMLSEKNNYLQHPPNFKSQTNFPGDFGETPDVEWLKKYDGSGKDIIQKSATDAAGNIFLIGDFSGTMTFAGTTLTSIGKRDVFLAKLDNAMNLLWIKQGSSGAFSSCVFYDLMIDDEQMFITGYFDGETFSIVGSSASLSGLSDALLIKTNLNGEVDLIKSFSQVNALYRGLAIASDNDQNIYLTGTTDGNTNYYHPSFLTKLDSGANTLWWQEYETAFNDLAVTGDQLYVSGSAYQDVWLGDVFLDPFIYSDAFVAKADTDGNYEWAIIGEHQQIPWGDSYLPEIEVGSSGDIFMAGYFRNNVEFGGVLLNSNYTDAFIVRISPEGEVIWANETGGAYNPLNAFTLMENDQPCISGGMGSSATFDDIIIETPDGGEGNYIAIYNSSGVAQSAFVVAYETDGLTTLPENLILQSGTTDLDAVVSTFGASGNILNSIISSGNSGTSQLTGLELDDEGRIYSLSNVYGHTAFFGVDMNVEKETMVLAGHAPDGNLLWTESIEGGLSWWNFTETTLKYNDAHERLFLHGNYEDTLKIGNLEFVSPNKAAFLASYSKAGEFLWAKNIPYNVDIQSVDTDASGNAYFIFGFSGAIEIEGESFTSISDGDALILKYDMDGNFISGKQIKTDVFFYALGLATIPTGGYYATMEPAGDTVFFNNGNSTMVLTPNDGRSIVAKFNDQGNYLWAKSFGHSPAHYGGFYCWPTASVTDAEANLYLTGSHGDSAMFDNIMLRTPYNRYSPYNAKIDPDGNALWANSIQIHRWGNNYCEADIDDDGNFYCMGDIRDTVLFGDWEYIPEGPGDMYVVRYDNNGAINWVKTLGSSSSGNHLLGMAVFEPDNLFVGGNFTNWITEVDHETFTSSSQAGIMMHIGDAILYSDINDENKLEVSVEAYPNPTKRLLYLDFKKSYQTVTVELLGMNGQKIIYSILKDVSGTRTISLPNLPAGVYPLTITAEGQTATRKILIQ